MRLTVDDKMRDADVCTGLVGHIEDIAVAKNQQGKKLGLRIIQALDFVAKEVGCYKVRNRSPFPLYPPP